MKVQKVELRGIEISYRHPNNILQLSDNKIFIVQSIFNIRKDCATLVNINDLFIYGVLENKKKI